MSKISVQALEIKLALKESASKRMEDEVAELRQRVARLESVLLPSAPKLSPFEIWIQSADCDEGLYFLTPFAIVHVGAGDAAIPEW